MLIPLLSHHFQTHYHAQKGNRLAKQCESGFDDILYSLDMGSFSHYEVSLQNSVRVLDIIQQLIMPDSPPPSVLSTKYTVISLALSQFGPYVTAQLIWGPHFEFATWQIPSLTHSVYKSIDSTQAWPSGMS